MSKYTSPPDSDVYFVIFQLCVCVANEVHINDRELLGKSMDAAVRYDRFGFPNYLGHL